VSKPYSPFIVVCPTTVIAKENSRISFQLAITKYQYIQDLALCQVDF